MKKFNKPNGFTLVEILLVVAFIAIATTTIYAGYFKTQKQMEILREARNLDVLKEGTQSLLLGELSYQNASNTLLNQNNITPNSMRDPSNVANIISNVFQVPIDVSPVSMGGLTNNGFKISYTGLYDTYCVPFVMQSASHFDEVRINNTNVKTLASGQYEVDLALASSECESNSGSTVVDFISVSSLMNSNTAGRTGALGGTPVNKPNPNTPAALSPAETPSPTATVDTETKKQWKAPL